MRAEKFIEKKKYGNILIRIFETKPLNNLNIDLLLTTIEEVAGDDYEAQYEAGLSHNYSDDWYSIDVEKVIDKFAEYKEFWLEDETYTRDRVNECLLFLEDLKEYTIYNTEEEQ